MFWKKKNDEAMKEDQGASPKTIEDLLLQLKKSPDFSHYQHLSDTFQCWISFFSSLVNVESIHRDILPFLYKGNIRSLSDIQEQIPIEKIERTNDLKLIQSKLMEGCLIIQEKESSPKSLIVPTVLREGRQVQQPEIETSIIGPKEAFVESLDTNISLLRKRIPIPQFTVEQSRVGKVSNTRVCLTYIKGIANEENVNTVRQRLQDLEVDHLFDASTLSLNISDNNGSPFPQFIDTERPDRTAAALFEGKIALLIDGSPNSLILPTNVVEYFLASDDYYTSWYFATAYRLLRLFAVAFSVFSSAIYVAILTYHYQLIPIDLLGSLITSRSVVTFSPMAEAIVLELMIELLREAGARLPTKVGQTIGIVGGIVIGTASVQAGFTSNVLLILVAMSALAAFTTPNYRMASAIRLLRFPIIVAAQFLGLLGVALCFAFFVSHLLKLTSLGRPFIEPIYPLRISDLRDSFIRFPFTMQSERPMFLRPNDTLRYNKERVKQKAGKREPDIDE
ncbi:spore germination protein [Sporolactobacillus shoreae]|uniref:Spore germination protein n=1 Tax=Sporolactobacillus shoreae TaxID=1465501 RepID=A0A4Z0GRH7_9BACL|nr:spore germination protein [Sporolactobacillus shoreae]TGA99208.1 spore germination protein [Sporolactobacillus shoreae]